MSKHTTRCWTIFSFWPKYYYQRMEDQPSERAHLALIKRLRNESARHAYNKFFGDPIPHSEWARRCRSSWVLTIQLNGMPTAPANRLLNSFQSLPSRASTCATSNHEFAVGDSC